MIETERLTNKKAGVDGCYGIIKRAYLNPAAHLYNLWTASSTCPPMFFRRMSGHKLTYQYAWLRHRQSIYSIVIRVITLISSENGGMNNLVAAFTALPGGYRNNNGNYNNMGNNCYFWSSTENNSNNAWNRKLNYNNSDVNRNNNNKQNGFSIRVVRYLNFFCQSFNHTINSK